MHSFCRRVSTSSVRRMSRTARACASTASGFKVCARKSAGTNPKRLLKNANGGNVSGSRAAERRYAPAARRRGGSAAGGAAASMAATSPAGGSRSGPAARPVESVQRSCARAVVCTVSRISSSESDRSRSGSMSAAAIAWGAEARRTENRRVAARRGSKLPKRPAAMASTSSAGHPSRPRTWAWTATQERLRRAAATATRISSLRAPVNAPGSTRRARMRAACASMTRGRRLCAGKIDGTNPSRSRNAWNGGKSGGSSARARSDMVECHADANTGRAGNPGAPRDIEAPS